jgi:hypothetical protein
MIPKFQWNITTKLILIIIIIFFSCVFLNSGVIEKFVSGEDLSCPDRLYYDGKKYYLFHVNDAIVKDKNPIIYNTYEEYLQNKPNQCKKLELTKPYTRKLSNKDLVPPTLPYEWDCQREQALSDAKDIDCVNKFYNIFSKEECKLFNDKPSKYYTNNAIERCKVRKTIEKNPSLVGNQKISQIPYAEEGLVRVGADIGGDPFRNIS